MLWAKKNSYKEFDNEKKFLRLENSPPHNFSNGPSLKRFVIHAEQYSESTRANRVSTCEERKKGVHLLEFTKPPIMKILFLVRFS